MALYFVTGALGGGKSLCAMSKIDEYLRRGRKVATNMNLNLEYLCGPDNDYTRVIRIPDAPSVSDLSAIGMGSDESGEKKHGLLVLDELGTWFNARDFADKSRKDVIKFCIHLRKRRWDVLFLVQDFTMVDKQMRGNITQYLVTCQRSHDFFFFRLLPLFHIATVRLKTKIKVGTWFYRSRHYYQAYDTEQLYFTTTQLDDDDLFVDEDLSDKQAHDMALNGLYCLLPPAYLGTEVRDAIRVRHRAFNRARLGGLLLMALIVVNGFLWPRAFHTANPPEIAPEVALEAPAGDAERPPAEPPAASWADVYGVLRIRSFARFGNSTEYIFQDPHTGITTTDKELAIYGVTVRSRGPNEALLVSDQHDFVSVFR